MKNLSMFQSVESAFWILDEPTKLVFSFTTKSDTNQPALCIAIGAS